MDDARLRAVIREEIALAVKTLEDAANWTEADEDALTAIRRTVETFQRHYSGACEEADEQRQENPFVEAEPVNPKVQALIKDGVRVDLAAVCGQHHNFAQLRDGVFCLYCGTPQPSE